MINESYFPQTSTTRRYNLLDLPAIGRFLRWRHSRAAMQAVMLLLSGLILFDGLLGPQVAYNNIATVSTWVHYRGFLMLALLVFGNFFCMACPFMLPRKLAKRLQSGYTRLFPSKRGLLGRGWPTWLPQKAVAIVLLLLFFWSYEAFNLWASPWMTAWVVIGYFGGAFLIDLFFKGAAFCKHVCPVGQFNMVYSTISPTQIAVIEPDVCATCTTKECIAGRDIVIPAKARPAPTPNPSPNTRGGEKTAPTPSPSPNTKGGELLPSPSIGGGAGGGGRFASASSSLPSPSIGGGAGGGGRFPFGEKTFTIPGCETHLFQPKKIGNLDCTFCLDCVHACPYDNVGILTQMPGVELVSNRRRSGIGQLSERFDIAFLIMVLSFGAFMQAFGMIPPVYELEAWLANLLGLKTEAPVLAIIFFIGVVALPLTLLSATAWLSQLGAQSPLDLKQTISRFAPSIIPLGAGMWAAHYSFHFFTGALTLVPVIQSFVSDAARSPLLGKPRWDLASLLTFNQIILLESIFLYAGLLGSLLVAWLIALELYRTRQRALRAWLPWALLFLLMLGSGLWIMLNPMEMRGTIFFNQ